MKNTLDDDEKGVADKLSADDKEEIENTINEALDWLDENPDADKETYEAKQQELAQVVQANPPSDPSTSPAAPMKTPFDPTAAAPPTDDGPKIEEVD